MSASRWRSLWRRMQQRRKMPLPRSSYKSANCQWSPTIIVAARGDVLLFEEAGTNRVRVLRARAGDAEKGFAEADYRRRERFSVQRHTAFPMEPRGLMADWDGGRMVVHGAAKVPFFNRRTLAEMLGLAESAVDLIEVDVGGGFGARGEFYPEDFLIPFAARHVNGLSAGWRTGASICSR